MCLNMNWFMNKLLKERKTHFLIRFHRINLPEMRMERMYDWNLVSKYLDVNERQYVMADVLSKV
jgi:hypothetical protein